MDRLLLKSRVGESLPLQSRFGLQKRAVTGLKIKNNRYVGFHCNVYSYPRLWIVCLYYCAH